MLRLCKVLPRQCSSNENSYSCNGVKIIMDSLKYADKMAESYKSSFILFYAVCSGCCCETSTEVILMGTHKTFIFVEKTGKKSTYL